MTTFNGLVVGGDWEWRTVPPQKADEGHSPIAYGRRATWQLRERRAVKCQCGKLYTGWGDTPLRTWERHLRFEKEGV